MGANQSFPVPRYGCCIRPQNPNRCTENHSRMPKARFDRSNLSAAFSFPEVESCAGTDLLNINTATEEELMTLPGINRQTAQNIVEYRRQIDGFRKVEDLALVSGVGATRLNHIRAELTVGRRSGGLSKNSSASSSGIDLSMNDNVSRGSAGQARFGAKVNVNTSNVFQLMKVRFISQNLAEYIVTYRDRKGPFSSFGELLKVKGMKPEILSAIQPYLVLEDDALSSLTCADVIIGNPQTNSKSGFINRGELKIPAAALPRASFRNSKMSTRLKNSLRLASWNLDNCGVEKMENPGVREVIAMTILENGFGIVALQEITDSKSLQKLVDELTSPVLDNVKNWNGCHGDWKHIISSPFVISKQTDCHLAFLYDAGKDIQLISSGFTCTTTCCNGQVSVPVYMAEFKVGFLKLLIANVYLDSPMTDAHLKEALVPVLASILSHSEEQGIQNVMLMGHFGVKPESLGMEPLIAANFSALLLGENFTDISSKRPNGSLCTENVWLSRGMMKFSSGKADVIRDGLTSPWIPDGMWSWGGVASGYCPVVAEVLIDGSANS